LHTPAQGAPLAAIVAASDNIELVILVLKVLYLLRSSNLVDGTYIEV
jgi:hypothetical protein